MNARQAKAFRKERASELRSLAEILQVAGLARDASPLLSAAGQCGNRGPSGELSWGYTFAGLEFNLNFDELRHSKPEGAELDTVELSVSLSGICLDESVSDDPFTNLGVNVVLHGLSQNAEPLMDAWHLDKHQGGESPFDHPDYHIHHGGRKIWESQGFNYGSHLLLESPCLEHKPLDGILAVNFVLANFAGTAWQTLKAEEVRYVELIHDAEKRCHLAYAQALLKRIQSVK